MHRLSDAKVPQMFESTNIAIYDATATGLAIGVLKEAGIDVIEATEKMMGTTLADGSMQLSVKQKRALETAYVQDEHQPTVVSSADGANVLKEFVNVIKKYESRLKLMNKVLAVIWQLFTEAIKTFWQVISIH